MAPRSTTETFFFFGDSLTLGVNDNAMPGGWVSRLVLLGSQAGWYDMPPATFYNLGVRKHSSLQIRERWASEYRSRVNDATVPYLIFCFGTVDMAAPNGNVAVPMQERTPRPLGRKAPKPPKPFFPKRRWKLRSS